MPLKFYFQRKLFEATELDGMSSGLFGLVIPEFTLNMRKNVKKLE